MSRGFIYNDEQNEVVSEAKAVLKESLDNTDIKGMDKVALSYSLNNQR